MTTSIAAPAALYTEKTSNITSHDRIDQCLEELARNKGKVRTLSFRDLIGLADACLEGMIEVADDWIAAGCKAKGIPLSDSLASEEIATGPLATARYLRLIQRSLADIEARGVPQLPGEVVEGPDGKLRVQAVPAKGLFDAIAFSGFKAHVVMEEGVTRSNLPSTMAGYYRDGRRDEGIALVLGAGNVSSIAPTDAFSKFFQEGKVVLLKMNPVNEYLGPIFERAFAPLINAGFLRIVYGGADVGSYAINHDLVDEVHITGSIYSHDSIVWGPPGPERERRKAAAMPLLTKRITSELGNVSPWIMVPGEYTDGQLAFQAENLVSSIVNNCSFNCVATKCLVTWKGWKQRERFLDLVDKLLTGVPRRKAYYPGAEERFRKFAKRSPGNVAPGQLPWTLIRDVDPDKEPLYFEEESFVCVFVETALGAASEGDFVGKMTNFANDRLWGTLGCTVVAPPSFRRDPAHEKAFQKALCDLRYGTIGVNYWSGLSYAMMSTPWGGYPGGTLDNPTSGIGWVHNTLMLDRAEKAILEGPITSWPRPLWFPSNRNAVAVTKKVVDLYHKPSVLRLPGLLLSALRG